MPLQRGAKGMQGAIVSKGCLVVLKLEVGGPVCHAAGLPHA